MLEGDELFERVASAKTEKQRITVLADEGESFNHQLHKEFNAVVRSFPDCDVFSLAIAFSLQAGNFAKYTKPDARRYYKTVNKYIYVDDVVPVEKKWIVQYAGELGCGEGQVGLASAIETWQNIALRFDYEEWITRRYSMRKLKEFQDLIVKRVLDAEADGERFGVGPWLVAAPFKWLACKPRLWPDPQLEKLLMPHGSQVRAGMHRLKELVTLKVPSSEPEEFADGLTDAYLLQGEQMRLARAVRSRTIHINSGFWLLGQKDE